jgi:hypothetical protein
MPLDVRMAAVWGGLPNFSLWTSLWLIPWWESTPSIGFWLKVSVPEGAWYFVVRYCTVDGMVPYWRHAYLVIDNTFVVASVSLARQHEIQVYRGASSTIVAGNRHRREGWCLAIWFDWSALNWDHVLVNCGYQHPSRLLTLWTKRNSGLSRGIFQHRCGEQTQGGKLCLAIWFDCSALN